MSKVRRTDYELAVHDRDVAHGRLIELQMTNRDLIDITKSSHDLTRDLLIIAGLELLAILGLATKLWGVW